MICLLCFFKYFILNFSRTRKTSQNAIFRFVIVFYFPSLHCCQSAKCLKQVILFCNILFIVIRWVECPRGMGSHLLYKRGKKILNCHKMLSTCDLYLISYNNSHPQLDDVYVLLPLRLPFRWWLR